MRKGKVVELGKPKVELNFYLIFILHAGKVFATKITKNDKF